jgi:histidyl-tRNA synthetase
MSGSIEPRLLKGFHDFLPERELLRKEILRKLEATFRLFGFVPIDTPVLEYSEILLGKGGGETDKQIYRFRDHGGRDVAMRYDLTVPFARFMASHLGELHLPFKRYHAAKAWRGENTQKGRFREFLQVDFDIVGTDSPSADLEILLLMRECMRNLGVERYAIHFAHRGLFNAFLSDLGVGERSVDVLRIVDKERKIGAEKTREMLADIAGEKKVEAIMKFIGQKGPARPILERLQTAAEKTGEPISRLSEISRGLHELGVEESFILDTSITRGLDYYTGIVFETFLLDIPDIGSVCSGGRYNDLASLYTTQSIPGVGASIGLDRLLSALEAQGVLQPARAAADVLVLFLDDALLPSYQRFAMALRAEGISAEVYPEAKKLSSQFHYAEKKGIRLALIHGPDEAGRGTVGLKDLESRQSYDGISLGTAIEKAKELLR